MSFMISGSLALIFHPYQLVEVILMCIVQLITIRYGSCSICALVIDMLVIVIIVIIVIVLIIVIIVTIKLICKNAWYCIHHCYSACILSLV